MTTGRRPRAALAMWESLPSQLFGHDWLHRLGELVDLVGPVLSSDAAWGGLDDVDTLIACWGCPGLTDEMLDRMPALRNVVYAAGSIKSVATPEAYRRGIEFSSGADINATPVAEYTLGLILLAAKRTFHLRDAYRASGASRPGANMRWGIPGTTVGVVGASRIGRRLIQRLQSLDLRILVHDPTLTAPIVGCELVSFDELLGSSDIVSLHAPLLAATRHQIDAEALGRMRDGATLINTARGGLVDESALLAELRSGRLYAILDVTETEPLKPDHPLLRTPNAFVTPHIAGAVGSEIAVLGDAAIEEVRRISAGLPLLRQVRGHELSQIA